MTSSNGTLIADSDLSEFAMYEGIDENAVFRMVQDGVIVWEDSIEGGRWVWAEGMDRDTAVRAMEVIRMSEV